MKKEQWAKIPHHPSYEISNRGRARSIDHITKQANGARRYRGKILSLHVDHRGKGYLSFLIQPKNGKDVRIRIHRFVAKLFVPNPEHKPEVNHKDGNPKNNRASNLEWMTHAENQSHAAAKGFMSHGEKHVAAKLTDNDVIEIRRIGRTVSLAVLAERFHVSRSSICEVLTRKRWKHLPQPSPASLRN